MSFLKALFEFHSHYFGIPHPRETDNRLVTTCYECGKEREVKVALREGVSR
jgi:hypothetical protein